MAQGIEWCVLNHNFKLLGCPAIALRMTIQPTDLRTLASAPLAGLKVIELHAIGPVPFAGRLLQTLGAHVSRVSPLSDPGLGVAMEERFDLLNAGKTAIKCDLKSAEGLAQTLELIGHADVLLEGFRPGVLERLQLAPATLLNLNPKLVIGRLSGWGTQGPLAARAGHDINYLAISGLLQSIGTAGAPHPPLNVVADFGGGAMHLVVGVLAMMARRAITGQGGVADTSILAGTIGLTPMFYGLLANGRWNLERENNLLDGMLPFYRVYKTSDDKFVAVGALEAKFYRELLEVLNLSSQIDAAVQYKPSSWASTTALFSQTIASKTRDQWAQLALAKDACLSPVLNFSEASDYAHNQANQWHIVSSDLTEPSNIITFKAL